MSHNTFGHLFRVTTFGESHGIALGCVVDGCPPGLPLEAEEIQAELDRRKPGQSRFTTQRTAIHHAAPRARSGADPVGRVLR
jgi:chorismate synthase